MTVATADDERCAQLILDSANVALSTVAHEGTFYRKLVDTNLKMCGLTLLEHVRDDDEPGFLTPIDVSADGKWQNGCLLALADRAIVVWWTGTFRFKHFVRVYPYADIEDVEIGETTKMGVGGGKQDTLRITARDPLDIRVVEFSSGPNLPQFLAAMLRGGVKFEFSGGG